MKIIVSFSGGKDSQACLIKACKDFGPNNIEAVFCDTGWEHELTYKHVGDVCTLLNVRLVVLKSKVGGFADLCKKMKWFPDTTHRMCTVQLKIQPMIDYVIAQEDDVLVIQGIRAAESSSRSKLPCSADYFADYLSEDFAKRLYRKNDVRAWCKNHKAIVERPMLGASAQDVIDYILQAGQQPNPLYRRGFSRVGCYPCIYARLSEIKAMRNDKDYVQRVLDLEYEVNQRRTKTDAKYTQASFFDIGKIPSRYCKTYGNGVPSFEDIINYVSRNDSQLDLFEPSEGSSCMSIYHGLCE